MAHAKQQAWYKNTIFMFISDHSHLNPMQRNYYEAAQRRIPFLIYGEKEPFWFAFGVGTIGGLLMSLLVIPIYLPLFLKFQKNTNLLLKY